MTERDGVTDLIWFMAIVSVLLIVITLGIGMATPREDQLPVIEEGMGINTDMISQIFTPDVIGMLIAIVIAAIVLAIIRIYQGWGMD